MGPWAPISTSTPYIERYHVRPAYSAIESWFASTDQGKPPPGWKLSSIVLLVPIPIVMLTFFSVHHGTLAMNLEPALGIFIGNAVSVAITGFLLIPWASKLLTWWLVPPAELVRIGFLQRGLPVLALYAISMILLAFLITRCPS